MKSTRNEIMVILDKILNNKPLTDKEKVYIERVKELMFDGDEK